jgi:hypothetical protein
MEKLSEDLFKVIQDTAQYRSAELGFSSDIALKMSCLDVLGDTYKSIDFCQKQVKGYYDAERFYASKDMHESALHSKDQREDEQEKLKAYQEDAKNLLIFLNQL